MEENNIDPIQISQLISKSMLGELSATEKKQFEGWLNENEKNREIYEDYKNDEEVGRDLDFFYDVDLNSAWESMQRKVLGEGVEEQVERSMFYGLFQRYKMGAAAAIFFLAGWATFLIFQSSGDPGIVKDVSGVYDNDVLPGEFQALLTLSDGKVIQLTEQNGYVPEHEGASITGQKEENYNTLSVPRGGVFEVRLADGTKVWMNSESELQFPVQFSAESRRVKLKGEAYFEVAKNKLKPFVIDIAGSGIEVLGTEFNVNATNSAIQTTLVEGSVKLWSETGATEILAPGDLGRVSKEVITKEKADLRKVLAWKNNEFYFKDDRLVDILNQLALWYDLEVVVAKGLENTLISGSIDKDVKLSEALAMLKYVTKGSFKVEGRKLTIAQ